MGVNSLPKTVKRVCVCVTRQRRDCDLNPGPSAPESSTLTTRPPSQPGCSSSSGSRRVRMCREAGQAGAACDHVDRQVDGVAVVQAASGRRRRAHHQLRDRTPRGRTGQVDARHQGSFQTWNSVTFCDPATLRPRNPATRRPS